MSDCGKALGNSLLERYAQEDALTRADKDELNGLLASARLLGEFMKEPDRDRAKTAEDLDAIHERSAAIFKCNSVPTKS